MLTTLFHSWSTSPYLVANYWSLLGLNNISRLCGIPLVLLHHHHHHHDNNNNHTITHNDHHQQQQQQYSELLSISASEFFAFVDPQMSSITLKSLKGVGLHHFQKEIQSAATTLFSHTLQHIQELLLTLQSKTEKISHALISEQKQANNNDDSGVNNQEQQQQHQTSAKTNKALIDLLNLYNIYYKNANSPKHRSRIYREYMRKQQEIKQKEFDEQQKQTTWRGLTRLTQKFA